MKKPAVALRDIKKQPREVVRHAAKSVGLEQTVRLNVDLPKELHHRLKVRTATDDTEIKIVVTQMIEDYLAGSWVPREE